jgi:hypothetical protein
MSHETHVNIQQKRNNRTNNREMSSSWNKLRPTHQLTLLRLTRLALCQIASFSGRTAASRAQDQLPPVAGNSVGKANAAMGKLALLDQTDDLPSYITAAVCRASPGWPRAMDSPI